MDNMGSPIGYQGVLNPPTASEDNSITETTDAGTSSPTDYKVLVATQDEKQEQQGLKATYNALTRKNARLELIRQMAVESPLLSDKSNTAIRELQGRLDAGADLKKAVIIGPWLTDFASKTRIPGVPGLFSPKASPSGKAAKNMAPSTAVAVDDIALGRAKTTVVDMLRQPDLSPEERNYWQNMASLIGVPH